MREAENDSPTKPQKSPEKKRPRLDGSPPPLHQSPILRFQIAKTCQKWISKDFSVFPFLVNGCASLSKFVE
jgi:hypothetical protein